MLGRKQKVFGKGYFPGEVAGTIGINNAKRCQTEAGISEALKLDEVVILRRGVIFVASIDGMKTQKWRRICSGSWKNRDDIKDGNY